VADGKILRLLKLWLKSPIEEVDEKGNTAYDRRQEE